MRKFGLVCSTVLLAACAGSSPAPPTAPGPVITPVSLASLTIAPSTVAGGVAAVGTVTLTAAAPANGATISLASNVATVRVSPTLVVPSGATSATFAVSTDTVSVDADATITATLDGVAKTATLRVTGVASTDTAPIVLSTQHDDVISGDSTMGTITSTSDAPAGGTRINLSASDPTVSVPPSVVIAAGARSVTFDIRTSTVLTAKDVRITATVDGALGATPVVVVIKLLPPRPRIDSVSPANALPGTSVNVTITGSMFLPGAALSVSGSGVTLSNIVIDSLTSIRATLIISSSATAGARQVSVTTASGSSSVAFTVGDSAPVPPPGRPAITSVSPADLRRHTTGGLTIYGTNFTSGSTVSISGSGVNFPVRSYSSSTMLIFSVEVLASAPLGARTLTVTSAGGTSPGHSILVMQNPRITTISPQTGRLGTIVDVVITGFDFVAPVTVTVGSCRGTTVSNVTHVSETQLNVRLSIAADAEVGMCVIYVGSGGWTAMAVFENVRPPD